MTKELRRNDGVALDESRNAHRNKIEELMHVTPPFAVTLV
jgi:hypothetical protein